jgi:hypothetical protein
MKFLQHDELSLKRNVCYVYSLQECFRVVWLIYSEVCWLQLDPFIRKLTLKLDFYDYINVFVTKIKIVFFSFYFFSKLCKKLKYIYIFKIG